MLEKMKYGLNPIDIFDLDTVEINQIKVNVIIDRNYNVPEWFYKYINEDTICDIFNTLFYYNRKDYEDDLYKFIKNCEKYNCIKNYSTIVNNFLYYSGNYNISFVKNISYFDNKIYDIVYGMRKEIYNNGIDFTDIIKEYCERKPESENYSVPIKIIDCYIWYLKKDKTTNYGIAMNLLYRGSHKKYSCRVACTIYTNRKKYKSILRKYYDEDYYEYITYITAAYKNLRSNCNWIPQDANIKACERFLGMYNDCAYEEPIHENILAVIDNYIDCSRSVPGFSFDKIENSLLRSLRLNINNLCYIQYYLFNNYTPEFEALMIKEVKDLRYEIVAGDIKLNDLVDSFTFYKTKTNGSKTVNKITWGHDLTDDLIISFISNHDYESIDALLIRLGQIINTLGIYTFIRNCDKDILCDIIIENPTSSINGESFIGFLAKNMNKWLPGNGIKVLSALIKAMDKIHNITESDNENFNYIVNRIIQQNDPYTLTTICPKLLYTNYVNFDYSTLCKLVTAHPNCVEYMPDKYMFTTEKLLVNHINMYGYTNLHDNVFTNASTIIKPVGELSIQYDDISNRTFLNIIINKLIDECINVTGNGYGYILDFDHRFIPTIINRIMDTVE